MNLQLNGVREMNKKIIIVVSVFIAIFSNVLMASESHHSRQTTVNNYTSTEGIASAISAAQCHFDNGSFHLQLCGGVGYSDNREAATFGIAKKYKDFLLNGTITTEDNHTTFGFGLNWKVK